MGKPETMRRLTLVVAAAAAVKAELPPPQNPENDLKVRDDFSRCVTYRGVFVLEMVFFFFHQYYNGIDDAKLPSTTLINCNPSGREMAICKFVFFASFRL